MAPLHGSSFTNMVGNMIQTHGQGSLSTSNIGPVTPEALEIAGRLTESMLALDAQFPNLAEKLRIGIDTICTTMVNVHSLKTTMAFKYNLPTFRHLFCR